MAEAKQKGEAINFKCRLCGHTEYNKVEENNGIMGPGFQSWTIIYFCENCGVAFQDPENFSVSENK